MEPLRNVQSHTYRFWLFEEHNTSFSFAFSLPLPEPKKNTFWGIRNYLITKSKGLDISRYNVDSPNSSTNAKIGYMEKKYWLSRLRLSLWTLLWSWAKDLSSPVIHRSLQHFWLFNLQHLFLKVDSQCPSNPKENMLPKLALYRSYKKK